MNTMDKIVHIPLLILSWSVMLVTNIEDPRFILIDFVLIILSGISRHFFDVLNHQQFSIMMALANVSVSLAIGWLGILIGAFFLAESEKLHIGLYAIGISGALFATSLMKGIPIIFARWQSRHTGVELSEKEIKEITKPKPSPRRRT